MEYRNRVRQLLPGVLVSQTTSVILGTANTIMSGNISNEVLSGVGNADTLILVLVAIFDGFGVAGTVLVGQFLGRQENAKASGAAKLALLLGAAICTLIAVALFFVRGRTVQLLFPGVSAEITAASVDYLTCALFSIPLACLFSQLSGIFRSAGDSVAPMAAGILVNVINIVVGAQLILGAFGGTRYGAAGADWHDCHSSVGSIVHIAIENVYAGHIVIADEVKPDAAAAIAALKRMGIQKTVMLTGDIDKVGRAVGAQLGLDEVHTGLLPDGKTAAVEALLERKPRGAALAFVGDGINDAPVLSRADIGIAMGAMGSDAAIEAADVVLMDDKPTKVAEAVDIAIRTMRIVRQNIVFALAVKAVVLALGALGFANMWLAVFADVGVTVDLPPFNGPGAMLVNSEFEVSPK